MTKRLQVLLSEEDYADITSASKESDTTVSEWVRSALHAALRNKRSSLSSSERVSRILRYAKFSGPTADMDQILSEIQQGQSFDLE